MFVEIYQAAMSPTSEGWLDIKFIYNAKIVNIMRSMKKKRFDRSRKVWSIPSTLFTELITKLDWEKVKYFDYREQGKTELKMAVNIKTDGFTTTFGDLISRPEMSRLWYLKRPRDGYRVAELLNQDGYNVEVYDEVESVSLSMSRPSVELYDFQNEAMDFLRKNNYNGLIALDMGLGKTIVACQAIYEIGNGPILIVAPSSLLYQWSGELNKHYGYDRAFVLTSKVPTKDRQEVVDSYDIIITNYELLLTFKIKRQFELMILDEVHRTRHWQTKTSKAVANIAARRVIGLSGTPITNKLEDLYNVADQIKPAYFGTMREFKRKYIIQDGFKRSYKNLDEVYAKLNGLMFRKRKDEVSLQLPKIIEQCVQVVLSGAEVTAYTEMLKKQKHILAAISNAKVFAVSSALRMDIDVSSKERELMNILEEMSGRTIVFTESKAEVKRLSELLKEKEVFALHGDVSKQKREDVKKLFKDSDDGILLMTEIGTEGLNLQYTGNLVNFSLPWTDTALQQRNSRIHRDGSDFDKVHIVNMTSKGTIDDHVMDVIKTKKGLTDRVVNGIPEEVVAKMRDDLFRLGITVQKDGTLVQG